MDINEDILMKFKDYFAILLLRIIFKMGYLIYIRKSVDDPRINGSDIGIYQSEHFRVIALCSGVLHRARRIDEMDFDFIGKK